THISYMCSERSNRLSSQKQERSKCFVAAARSRPVLDAPAAGATRAATHRSPAIGTPPGRDHCGGHRSLLEGARLLTMAAEREQPRIVDFYTEVVLPALA